MEMQTEPFAKTVLVVGGVSLGGGFEGGRGGRTVGMPYWGFEFHFRGEEWVFFWEGETGSEESTCGLYVVSHHVLLLLFIPLILLSPSSSSSLEPLLSPPPSSSQHPLPPTPKKRKTDSPP